MKQIQRRLSKEQVKEVMERYDRGEISREIGQEILRISKTRFFEIIKRYRRDGDKFSIGQELRKGNNRIDRKIEKKIKMELEIDKGLIEDKATPVRRYNYSYIKREIENKGKGKVSLTTIIRKAKEWGYYKGAQKSKNKHDRQVLSNYSGELIQHDSSYHLFAPRSGNKWYLITSIDDNSRFMVYAQLYERESSVAHIKSLEEVFIKYGVPLKYYTDRHSIFKYVEGRDDVLKIDRDRLGSDDVDTQWEQVLRDCNVDSIHALSPQAKGKIERPYRWLQDHLVRTCARKKIIKIEEAREILKQEVQAYNYERVHSTIDEIPAHRFKRARQMQSVWRKFEIIKPYESIRDIFCIREKRIADGYRRISLNNNKINVNKLEAYDEVEIRIYVINERISEMRFWREGELIDIQTVKNSDYKRIYY